MRQHLVRVKVPTRGRSLVDVTHEIRAAVRASGLQEGLVTVFVRHTSASVIIQENADPDVLGDMLRFFARLVPMATRATATTPKVPTTCRPTCARRSRPRRSPCPSPAERSSSAHGRAVYLFEHRSHPHTRELVLHVLGE
jgi:thiamine phosphate synthase YjbQ (UPF0047 family)